MKMNRIFILITIACFCGGCVLNTNEHLTSDERLMNELPMYGGQHDPTVAPNKEFSRNLSELGWNYYYEGDLDTAIKRFNQSWMFDRDNVKTLWGFGVIMGRRAYEEQSESHIRESVRYLEMAVSLQSTNA